MFVDFADEIQHLISRYRREGPVVLQDTEAELRPNEALATVVEGRHGAALSKHLLQQQKRQTPQGLQFKVFSSMVGLKLVCD